MLFGKYFLCFPVFGAIKMSVNVKLFFGQWKITQKWQKTIYAFKRVNRFLKKALASSPPRLSLSILYTGTSPLPSHPPFPKAVVTCPPDHHWPSPLAVDSPLVIVADYRGHQPPATSCHSTHLLACLLSTTSHYLPTCQLPQACSTPPIFQTLLSPLATAQFPSPLLAVS